MHSAIYKSRTRRGVTLVELLVVLGIFALLLGIAVPLMRYGTGDRKSREATRELNAWIVGAQARAVEAGRPVGIWLERMSPVSPGNAAVTRVYMAEVPPPYSGDVLNARVSVNSSGQLDFKPTGAADMLEQTESIIAVDDTFGIKFDYKGPIYFGGRSQAGYFLLSGTVPPGATSVSGVPFQIYRWPERSMVPPLELPNGIAIDLDHSAITNVLAPFSPQAMSNQQPAPQAQYQPIIVMFNPSGAVESFYYGDWELSLNRALLKRVPSLSPPDDAIFGGTIYFLIGQAEKVGLTGTESNLYEPNNFWIGINIQTGAVVSAENDATMGRGATFLNSSQSIGGGE